MPATDPEGRTLLHHAAIENDRLAIREALLTGADPDAADHQGFTPLHLAAQENAFEAAELLLDEGAFVDAANAYGNTPLHVAVFNSRGQGDLIRLLRQRGADPLTANHTGQTPLGLARLIANYDVGQFFDDLPA